MKITELINKLERIQKDLGDVEVKLYLKDIDGDICDTHSITKVDISNDENAYIAYEEE